MGFVKFNMKGIPNKKCRSKTLEGKAAFLINPSFEKRIIKSCKLLRATICVTQA